MPAFHQQLSELETYRHSALVVEANYSDFLNPQKMKFYGPIFGAKAIAELYGLHPGLTIVFTGNRKLAREWTQRFFAAISAHEKDAPHPKVTEVVAKYGKAPETMGGNYYDIRKEIGENFPERFTRSMIRDLYPHVPEATVNRVLLDMKRNGVITPHGRGWKAYWTKIETVKTGTGAIFSDTHPEVEQYLVEMIRGAPVFRRLQMAASLVKTTRLLSWRGICERYPDASEAERMRHFLYLLYEDKDLAKRVTDVAGRKRAEGGPGL